MPVIPSVMVRDRDNSSGEIVKSKLLLVEGKDETLFFEAFFKKNEHLNGQIGDIQIIEMGGVDKFKTELPALINRTGFSEKVESVAIIRDADNNFESAFQSICAILNRHGLPHPTEHSSYANKNNLKVGIFVMPGNSEGGTMLEDLCLRTQSDNPIMNCVNSFFSCLEGIDIEMPRNIAKAKSQVFLAAMPKIVSSLGIGANKGYWDLNHDSLMGLSNFLVDL